MWHFDFSITLGNVSVIVSILVGSSTIARGLHRLTQTLKVGTWQHKVMWNWFKRHHPEQIPIYPLLAKEDPRG